MNPLLASMPPDELTRLMRELDCWSAGDLARLIGCSRGSIGTWLRGQVGVPRPIAMLIRLLVAERQPQLIAAE